MVSTHTLILPDGRKLAYAEFGRPDGLAHVSTFNNHVMEIAAALRGE
jgi:hypothetical protein